MLSASSRDITGDHLRYLNREVRDRKHRQADEAFLDVHAPVAALSSIGIESQVVGFMLCACCLGFYPRHAAKYNLFCLLNNTGNDLRHGCMAVRSPRSLGGGDMTAISMRA